MAVASYTVDYLLAHERRKDAKQYAKATEEERGQDNLLLASKIIYRSKNMNAKEITFQYRTTIKSAELGATILKFPQNKNKGGRPSKYTDELVWEICMIIASSDIGIARLCKEHKHWPSKKTIFNWLKKNKEFQRKYEVAKQIQFEYLNDELLELLDKDCIYIDNLGNRRINPMAIELIRLKADAFKWKIVHLMPRKYQIQ